MRNNKVACAARRTRTRLKRRLERRREGGAVGAMRFDWQTAIDARVGQRAPCQLAGQAGRAEVTEGDVVGDAKNEGNDICYYRGMRYMNETSKKKKKSRVESYEVSYCEKFILKGIRTTLDICNCWISSREASRAGFSKGKDAYRKKSKRKGSFQ